MKGSKGLREVHEIMENIYEEEKELTPAQRVEKVREESNKFLRERKMSLKRVKPSELKHVIG
jgi:hypothetical protein